MPPMKKTCRLGVLVLSLVLVARAQETLSSVQREMDRVERETEREKELDKVERGPRRRVRNPQGEKLQALRIRCVPPTMPSTV